MQPTQISTFCRSTTWKSAKYVAPLSRVRKISGGEQGCQIYLCPNIPKREKYTKGPQTTPNGHTLYQMGINYTKRPYVIPNDHKLQIPNGRKIYQHFPFQGSPKYTQIGIFGLKLNHLATLAGKIDDNLSIEWREEF
jgi:hypothetical protein